MALNDQDQLKKKLLERHSEAKIIRKVVFIIAIVFILVFSGVVGGGYFYIKSALKPLDPSSKKVVEVSIPIGSSVSAIGNILEKNGIIKDAKVFRYYIKFKNESDLMAGDYKLSPSMTLNDIIGNLKTGKVVQEVVFKLTIPEGKQIEQIATIIAEKTKLSKKSILKKLDDRTFIEQQMKKYPSILTEEILQKNINHPLEGYLFPATYSFYKENPSIEEIVDMMLSKTSEILLPLQDELENKQMTPHRLLTLASLIEEEATAKTDREYISSVFYNRMDIGMPLQTDPTVLYALGQHKERVLYKDLEVESPYNTYIHTGLPPSPIANAGSMSISAALNPADTDYLYFLATSTGEVIYSKTLDEHNRQKAKHISNNE